MMHYKRIISFICVIAIVASLAVVPAYAVEALPGPVQPLTPTSGGGGLSVNLGDWVGDLARQAQQGITNKLERIIHDDVCTSGLSQNGRHNFQAQNTQVGSNYGNYYVCEYCGKSAGEVLDTAYDSYSHSLPARTLLSDGSLLWQVTYQDLNHAYVWLDNSSVCYDVREFDNFPAILNIGNNRKAIIDLAPDESYILFSIDTINYGSLGYKYHDDKTLNFAVPIDGTYYLEQSTAVDADATDSYSVRSHYEVLFPSINSVIMSAGTNMWLNIDAGVPVRPNLTDCIGRIIFPRFRIVPLAGTFNTNTGITINDTNYYSIDSRPASIAGDYGIMGDNNQLTKIDSQTIVNEADNSVYNPVTDTTYNVTSWEYNYWDRSYDLTLEGGDFMKVTYDDEYVRINEGDTVYNVYYVVEAPAQSNPSTQPGHVHSYSSEVTREPTCTTKGIKTYTCTECSGSYTESIPAPGHDWVKDREVLTEYDENGELVTQGYTIYKCTRCNEEYRSEDGTAPPTGAEETGLIIPEADGELQSYWERIKSLFQSLPEMFGDLTQFLKDGWPYVPDEIMALIEFGLGMVLFVGILNWIFKR